MAARRGEPAGVALVQRRRMEGAACGDGAVSDQERRPDQADRGDRAGQCRDDGAEAAHTQGDQDHVGHDADRDHHDDRLAADALP